MRIKLLPEYQPLFYSRPQHRYTLLTGGRGSGKSFHAAVFLLQLSFERKQVILFTRYTMTSAHTSIIPEFREKIALFNQERYFEFSGNTIKNKVSGSRIVFSGIKTSEGIQTAKLKSLTGLSTFVIDEAEEFTDEETFDAIDLSVREKNVPNRVIMIMNPSHRRHFIYQRFVAEPEACLHIHTTYQHNRQNLSESFLQRAEETRLANYSRYEHLYLGAWRDDVEGLLWTPELLARCKVESAPESGRTVLAIDPAVTAKPESDETGIVLVRRADDGGLYVLKDFSGRYTPAQWGGLIADICNTQKISYIVAEKNQGGDLVLANLRNCGVTARVKMVTATKGKYVRAEPVYSLYEQGRVKHLPGLGKLEHQMLTFNPIENNGSPDRVDALVWAITDLAIAKKQIGAS